MADKKPAAKGARKSAGGKTDNVFTDEERLAMKEYVKEKKAARGGADKEDGEAAVRAALAAMQGPDRALGERIHAIVKAAAPGLAPKTWYGMPAYARKGKMVCFFQSAAKFKARYATLGFSDEAHLDEGAMWPAYYALKTLDPDTEARIVGLVKQAVS